MSIFFVNERKQVPPPPPPVDWEAALQGVATHEPVTMVSAMGGISVEKAIWLMQECRRIEPLLIVALNAGTVTTKTAAVQFIKDNTEGFFPAVRYINIMQDHCTPSTFAQLLIEAQSEA